MICGACHRPVEGLAQRVLHHRFDDGSILCSTTAKRTFLYANETAPNSGQRGEEDVRGDDDPA